MPKTYWALLDERGEMYQTKPAPPHNVPRPCLFASKEAAETYARTTTFSGRVFAIGVTLSEAEAGSFAKAEPIVRSRYGREVL